MEGLEEVTLLIGMSVFFIAEVIGFYHFVVEGHCTHTHRMWNMCTEVKVVILSVGK